MDPGLQSILSRYNGYQREHLLPVLLEIQETYGYLSEDIMSQLASFFDLPVVKLYGAATFYDHFRFEPSEYDDRRMSLPDIAVPVIKENTRDERLKEIHLRHLLRGVFEKTEPLTPEEELEVSESRYEIIGRPLVFIGMSSCNISAGSLALVPSVKSYIADYPVEVGLVETGCLGCCHLEPLMSVQLPGKNRIIFAKVGPEDVPSILDAALSFNINHEKLLGQVRIAGSESWNQFPFVEELPFFRHQQRILTASSGLFDPIDIRAYIASGGYSSYLSTIHRVRPEEVCDLIVESRLRGRGGSGFPTGEKWKVCAQTQADQKYLICNALDSDPEAFHCRTLLESNPFLVLEGISIAAYACGATRAYIFLNERQERATHILRTALGLAREYGLTGRNIFDSGVDLTIQIFASPGAFICGEETALINAIEGRRGIPRNRPPYPAEKGLFSSPTIINNVETLANVPLIIAKGVTWFKSLGSRGAPGTKLISLNGKSLRYGIVEIPTGTSLHDIIYITGGFSGEPKAFKAIHLGGPAGYSLPEKMLDTPVDFDIMKDRGLGLGSASLSVLEEDACLIDMTARYLKFMSEESCGKCIPCREGVRHMAGILGSICMSPSGDDQHETLERFKGIMQLENLAGVIRETSLCGHGKNAVNPVLSTLKHFMQEYEEHVFDRKCAAGTCIRLRTYSIDTELCTGCMLCAKKCPAAAIIGTQNNPHFIVADKCTGCGICYDICRFAAILIN